MSDWLVGLTCILHSWVLNSQPSVYRVNISAVLHFSVSVIISTVKPMSKVFIQDDDLVKRDAGESQFLKHS